MNFNFIFYCLLCVCFLAFFLGRKEKKNKAGVVVYSTLTVLWLWSVLSFREPSGDPWRYMQGLNNISLMSFSEVLDYNGVPVGFALLNWASSHISIESGFFFSVIYIFCIVPFFIALKIRFNIVDSFILLMIYLLYPFYLTYLGSGFKQGIASGFMLFGLVHLLDVRKFELMKGLVGLLLATFFHSSFWLVNLSVLAWYIFYKNRSLNWVLWTLGLCTAIAIARLNETLINGLLPKEVIDSLGFSEYFDDTFTNGTHFASLNYVSGFRLDFAIFTFYPLIIILLFRDSSSFSKIEGLFKVYCLLASAYFLLCFIPFSDRIAAFSWFLSPYMIYKYTQSKRLKKIQNWFVFGIISCYPLLMITYTKAFFI